MKKLLTLLLAFLLISPTFAYTQTEVDQKAEAIKTVVPIVLEKYPDKSDFVNTLFLNCAKGHKDAFMREVCVKILGLEEKSEYSDALEASVQKIEETIDNRHTTDTITKNENFYSKVKETTDKLYALYLDTEWRMDVVDDVVKWSTVWQTATARANYFSNLYTEYQLIINIYNAYIDVYNSQLDITKYTDIEALFNEAESLRNRIYSKKVEKWDAGYSTATPAYHQNKFLIDSSKDRVSLSSKLTELRVVVKTQWNNNSYDRVFLVGELR